MPSWFDNLKTKAGGFFHAMGRGINTVANRLYNAAGYVEKIPGIGEKAAKYMRTPKEIIDTPSNLINAGKALFKGTAAQHLMSKKGRKRAWNEVKSGLKTTGNEYYKRTKKRLISAGKRKLYSYINKGPNKSTGSRIKRNSPAAVSRRPFMTAL